jgi:hypothetical protein
VIAGMRTRADRDARAGRAMPGGGEGSWRYLYERLGEKRFQQLCGALLAHVFPDVVCYPVGQKDGGRDAVRSGREHRYVYQVKWTNKRLRDPVAWLDGAIREEAANIRRLAAEGAEAYILLTCVAGTVKGHRDFPVGGQLISLRMDRLCPCRWSADLPAGQVSGVTPFPVVASASRRLLPSVRTRCA